MIAMLFPSESITSESPSLLHPMRVELARELSEAVRACDEVPEHYLDTERAQDASHQLAKDGDDAWTRNEIRDSFEMEYGCGSHFDRLLDHVNTLSWAYWRLHRAERRAYGKERK